MMVKVIADEILFLMADKGVGQIGAHLAGNDEWGKGGAQPLAIANKVETIYEELKARDDLGHINDKQSEGIEAFGNSFWEELKELLTEEETYVNWVKA